MRDERAGPRIGRREPPSSLAERLIDDARRVGTPNPDVYLVMDHVPELMRTFHEHWRVMFDHGVVDRDLKELVRRKVANYHACETCKSIGVPGKEMSIDDKLAESYSWREMSALTEREKAAMWLVDYLMGYEDSADHLYRELHEHFSDAEIVELGWFISFNVGTVRFVRSWNLHGSSAVGPPGAAHASGGRP